MRAVAPRPPRRLALSLLTVGATGALGVGLAPMLDAGAAELVDHEADAPVPSVAVPADPSHPGPGAVRVASHVSPAAVAAGADERDAEDDAPEANDAGDTGETDADDGPDEAPAPSRTVWDRLADCESGDWIDGGASFVEGSARWDYGIDFAHEGYEQFEGGLNFAPQTWDAFRDPDMPDHAGRATREQQIAVAEQVQAAQGWGAWPVCSRKLGLGA